MDDAGKCFYEFVTEPRDAEVLGAEDGNGIMSPQKKACEEIKNKPGKQDAPA